MAFPNIPISQIKATLKQSFDMNGFPAAFTLTDGTQFSIPAVEGFRGAENLTDGMQQETHRLKVLSDDWDAQVPAGRDPHRGDQVEFDGQRYAVQGRVRAKRAGQARIMYVMEIHG